MKILDTLFIWVSVAVAVAAVAVVVVAVVDERAKIDAKNANYIEHLSRIEK